MIFVSDYLIELCLKKYLKQRRSLTIYQHDI